MRGKAIETSKIKKTERITPASAGKSNRLFLRTVSNKDHPRECGEKGVIVRFDIALKGSPPRVRGKESFHQLASLAGRITPASAGKRMWLVGDWHTQ